MTAEQNLTRNLRVFRNADDENSSIEFKRSLAVVIGINDYGHGIPPLRTACADAKRLTAILTEHHGYEVNSLAEDVSGKRLKMLLEEWLPQNVGEEDRLIFYFAGHGIALNDDDGPAGYLIPQDADAADRSTFLPMQVVHDALTALPCRHCLVILDCCFSGAFRWSSTRSFAPPPKVLYQERYQRFLRSPAWQVLTSTSYDQAALDSLNVSGFGTREDEGRNHSPFALALFDALTDQGEESSDANNDGVIVATELYLYLRDHVEVRVEDEAHHQQTPGIWPLKRHDRGEFIFNLGEPNLEPAPELTVENNPYRGLQSYELDHAKLFYGRSEQIDQLVKQVQTQPFTAVLGASGTGKSSLVKAGVVPRLTQDQSWYALKPMRPTETPLSALAQTVIELTNLDPSQRSTAVAPESIRAVVDDWLTLNPDAQLLLVIDQYEELVTLCRDADERTTFQKLLDELLHQHSDRFRLIITLRTDFETQFTDSTLFARLKQRREKDVNAQSEIGNRFVVPPMDQSDLREVIEGPASERTLFFDPSELVDELINEVIQTPGALPLLSFTLEQLYLKYIERQEVAAAEGDIIERSLTQTDYDELGGVIGSLRTRADEEFDTLPDDAHRATMERVMLRMVATEGGELARRRVPMTELVYPNDKENERVQEVLNRLVDARLLIKDSVDVDSDGISSEFVEPAHDALIRAWDRLLRWKEQFAGFLSLQRTLTTAADSWYREGTKSNSGLLWQNNPQIPQLQAILFPSKFRDNKQSSFVRTACRTIWPPTAIGDEPTWLNKVESEFVCSSVVRRADVLKRIAWITTTIILTLGGLTIFAFFQQGQAQNNASLANERQLEAIGQSQRALAENMAGQSQLAIITDNEVGDLALILARDAFLTNLSVNTDRAVRLALQTQPWRRTIPSVVERHQGWVYSADVSPDNQKIVSGGADGTIRVWNAHDLSQKLMIFGHEGPVRSAKFSPDGTLIASGGSDHKIGMWDTLSGERVNQLSGHFDRVNSIAFSPDGTHIISGSDDRTVRLWEMDTGKEIDQLTGYLGPVNSVQFSSDGGRIVTADGNSSGGGGVRIWDVQSRQQVAQMSGHLGPVNSAAFNHDGTHIVSGGNDMTIRLWDVSTGRQIIEIKGLLADVYSVDFSPDGKYIVSGSASGRQVWSVPGGEEVATKYGHTHSVSSVVFDSAGEQIISSSWDGTVRIWDIVRDEEIVQNIGHFQLIHSIDFSPDGEQIVSGSWDNSIRIWDVKSGEEIFQLLGHSDRVNSVAYSPDGSQIASGSGDRTIRIWNAENANEVRQLVDHLGRVMSVAYSPDGASIVSGNWSGAIHVWDLTNEDENVEIQGHSGTVLSVAYSPDGKQIVSGGGDNSIRIWDVASGVEITELQGHLDSVQSVEYSPDGDYIVSGSFDKSIRIWNVESKAETAQLLGHSLAVFSVAFSPDGTQIASSSADQTVRIWDVESRNEIVQFRDHVDSIRSVIWHPAINGESKMDRALLASGSNDRSIRIWDVGSTNQTEQRIDLTETVTSVSFNTDGKQIISADADNIIRYWNAENGQEDAYTNIDAKIDTPVAFSPDMNYFMFGSDDIIWLWSTKLNEMAGQFSGHSGTIRSVAWSPEIPNSNVGANYFMASGGDDGTVRIWDLESETESLLLSEHIGSVWSIAFSHDGQNLVSGSDRVRVWNVVTGEEVDQLFGHLGPVRSVTYSPDGAYIASGSWDSTVRIWHLATRESLQLIGHSGPVNSVSFSPEGKYLVSGGDDATVRVWNVATGEEVAHLSGHSGSISSVHYSPTGTQIVSSSSDKSIRIWDSPHNVLLKAVARISRPAPILATDERQRFGIGDDVKLPDQACLQPLMNNPDISEVDDLVRNCQQ